MPEHGGDILEFARELPTEEERERAYQIIRDVEEQGRRNLKLQDGCLDLLHYLQQVNMPLSLATIKLL
jgi:hypothetical protein